VTTTPSSRPYPVKRRELVAEAPGLRVQILTLGPGHCVPWHHHSEITDTFFCLEGPMLVATRAPDTVHELNVGETCTVPAMLSHEVKGCDDGPCKFAIVQGVGAYDFVPDHDADG
jgi:quercetin dioxygenase-like cupin family protein